MNRKHRNYNQRQRKKYRIGEFQELGFFVQALPVRKFSDQEKEALTDALVAVIEDNNLLCGGGFNDEWGFFVMRGKKYTSATETQREIISLWLSARSELTEVKISELCDDWPVTD